MSAAAPRRVLVLGGSGMLGCEVVRLLARHCEVVATYRHAPAGDLPSSVTPLAGLDLCAPDAVQRALDLAAPDAVVNCAGMVKQRAEAADAVQTVEVNALLPHRLTSACGARGIRLVHISTDCVFSGDRDSRRGPLGYRETDPTDAADLYGRSKLLGETTAPGCVTLRLSLIGREAGTQRGLVEWFLAAPGPVRGFASALFTGLTTPEAARLIHTVLERHPDLTGLWHAAAPPISKLDLLRRLRDLARPEVEVVPVDEPFCDRRLDGSALARRIGWQAPGWDAMLPELFAGTGA